MSPQHVVKIVRRMVAICQAVEQQRRAVEGLAAKLDAAMAGATRRDFVLIFEMLTPKEQAWLTSHAPELTHLAGEGDPDGIEPLHTRDGALQTDR